MVNLGSAIDRLRPLKGWAPIKDESGQAALVIVSIVVIVAGVAISQLSTKNARRSLEVTQSTNTNLDKIRDAILVSALQNADLQLPCPADPDGTVATEDRTGTTCNTLRGVVPWQTIGLSPADVQGERGLITYVVDRASTDLCSSTTGRAGGIDDLNTAATDTILFALIEHGTNGFGATTASGAFVTPPTSTEEQANCPVGSVTDACNVTNAAQIRTGPTSDDATALFDDVVLTVDVSSNSFINANCLEINGSTNEPLNAQAGFSRAETSRNFVRTANESLQSANSFDSSRYDADGDSDNGSEKEVLRINSNDTFATRACAYSEPTYPLQGYTIRQYAEVFFESTNASSRGGGIVMGYFAHKTSGGEPTDVTRADPDGGGGANPLNAQPPCGGTDQYLGFGDENDALTTAASDAGDFDELAQPNDVFRFGLEIDTQTGFTDTGIAQQIFDPTNNHISIVLGNNNHASAEGAATQPPNLGATSATNLNGPVCREDIGTLAGDPGDSFGVDPTARGYARNVSTSSVDLEACYRQNPTTPGAETWLEDGDPIDQNTVSSDAFQQVRTELHWHGNNDCGANEIRFDAWVWNYANNDRCDTSTIDCVDLGSDYDDGTDAARRPHLSVCLAAPLDVAGRNPLEALRFGFTGGLPAAPTSADRGGEVTIQRFGLNFERLDGIGAKPAPVANAQSATVTETEIRNALYAAAPTGDLTLDQAYAYMDQGTGSLTDDIRVFMERGKFFLDENNYIGNTGVSDQNLISNISPGDSPFQLDTTFLDIDKREKLTFEFDSQYRKFTVNLRDFGSTDNTGVNGYLGSLNEQVVLRAYNTNLAEDSQLVATETYRTCDVNGRSNGTTSSMVISTDFGLTGSDYFDRVQIIPEPIDSSDIEGETRFYVGAVKACGADMNCSFDPTLVADNTNNDTEFRCVSFTPVAASSAGSGDSGEINPDTINPELGEADNQNEDTDRAWLDFNSYPDGTETFNLMISAIGEIHSRDNNNDEQSGFGVNNSYGTNDRLDTQASPTGSEAETETLTFHFDERWNRLRIGFSRFGQQTNTGLDQAQVQLCDGGPTGTCETLNTITACPGAGTQNNWRGDAFVTTGLASTFFDTVIVTPLPNSELTGDRGSDFYVRTLKACDIGGACTALTWGEDDGDGRFCDLTP